VKPATITTPDVEAEARKAFIEKGLASRADARCSGEYVSAKSVLKDLDSMLKDAKRKRKAGE